ncbi:MAG: hypothetical protein KF764_04255 [Labilithrix sp.]|nr:hypothetical protein [Labilithrix sp.]
MLFARNVLARASVFVAFIALFVGSKTAAAAECSTTESGYPYTPPSITSVSPTSLVTSAGSAALTVNGLLCGDPFSPGVKIFFVKPGAGSPVLVGSVANGATSASVTIPAGQLDTLGTARVFAAASGEGNLISNDFPIQITPPPPILTNVSPSVVLRGAATSVTLSGTNLTPVQTLTFAPPGGPPSSLTPASASATSITVALNSTLLATSGAGTFTLATPNGSSTAGISIVAPVIASTNPTSLLRGMPSVTLALSGTNFTLGGTPTVRFTPPGGTATVVSQLGTPTSMSISVTIPSMLMTTAGAASITVQTGAATSDAVTISIDVPCSGHGTLNGTTCTCDEAYSGATCDACSADHYNYPTCTACTAAGTCSGHGTCSGTGECVCTSGYQGTDCSTVVVPDAGTPDAGPDASAGEPDAGTPDAGTRAPDASSTDPDPSNPGSVPPPSGTAPITIDGGEASGDTNDDEGCNFIHPSRERQPLAMIAVLGVIGLLASRRRRR